MKKIAKKTIVFIATACVINTVVVAQTLVTPTGIDQLWATSSSNIVNGLNTALIDYPVGQNTYAQIAACAHGGVMGTASPYNGIEVTDLTYGITSINIPYPAGIYDMASTPDVIIGDSMRSAKPGRSYIMAVTFVNTNTPPDIEIDYFNIAFSAPGVFTVNYHSSEYLPYVGGFTNPLGTTHIDVVAEAGNTSMYGLPLCDKFFVTFDAENLSGVYDVFGAYGSLSSYTTTVTTTDITDTFHVADNWQPDVAGTQIKQGAGTADVGIFTWINQGNHELYKIFWDPVGGTTFLPSTWTSTINDPYSYPRIDANDNYFTNGSVSNANYKIVTEHYNSSLGNTDVESYDNLAAGVIVSGWISIGPGSYNHYIPTVAYGPRGPNGTQYMTSELADDGGIPGSYIMMNPIEEADPNNVAWDPTGSTARYYFQANNTNGIADPTDGVTTLYANAVSTPCNYVSDTSLVTWADYDSPDYRIWYKRSGYDWFGTGHYYRPGESIVRVPESTEPITVRPNPAYNTIMLNTIGNYSIANMLGQIVLKGYLHAGSHDIDVSTLPQGNYVVNIIKEGNPPVYYKFVKK